MLIAAAIGAACAIRDPRLSGASLPCNSSAQCGSDSVCFLGECRGSSAQLSLVLAEVRAPADQQVGVLQRSGIDLRRSALVDFQLQPLLSASGTVQQAVDGPPGAPVPAPDAGVVFTDSTPGIADRASSVVTQTDAAGAFSVSFAASTWNVLVVPPTPAPPVRPPPLASSTNALTIVLPAPSQLAQIGGTLTTGPSKLAGARVMAVDASGQALSVATTSGPGGAFSLQLPAGPPPYYLQIGPNPAAAPSDPAVPAFPLQGSFTTTAPLLGDLGPLPAPATLTGTVVDARQQPVASARVLALSVDPTGWTISRETVSDATGAYSLTLRAGNYVVQAAPDVDPALPGLSGEIPVTVPAALAIVCPDKSQGTGVVTRPDGQLVGAGYQIAAMRFPNRLVAGRLARATATDASGAFTIVGDAGHYRLEVVPPPTAGLPRKILSADLSVGAPTQLPAVQLSAALTVVGTVSKAGSQAPIAGATVDFFALDSSGARSVLIGSGLTDASGKYRAVLPDVPAPAN
jgi:hypothetical protein